MFANVSYSRELHTHIRFRAFWRDFRVPLYAVRLKKHIGFPYDSDLMNRWKGDLAKRGFRSIATWDGGSGLQTGAPSGHCQVHSSGAGISGEQAFSARSRTEGNF